MGVLAGLLAAAPAAAQAPGGRQKSPAADTVVAAYFAQQEARIRPGTVAPVPVGTVLGARTVLDETEMPSLNYALDRALVAPAEVLSGQTTGYLNVNFTVGRNGVVRDIRIATPLTPATDSAAVRAVRSLPRLLPGQQNGRPVALRYGQRFEFFGPTHVFDYVWQTPEFPSPGLPAYVRQHLRLPPVVAAEKLKGALNASFVVGPDGRVQDARIIKSLCTSCDAEVLRFLKALPPYRPGRYQGHPVAVRQTLHLRVPFGQVETDSLTRYYSYTDQMPVLREQGRVRGAVQAVQARVVPPAEVLAGTVAGEVRVRFTVGARGTVYGAKVVQSLSAATDAAALAAVARLPRFEGAQREGLGVAIELMVPVQFAAPSAGPK